METIATQVARGAEWLDAEAPGWEDKVDTAALNMVNKCVYMQVFGGTGAFFDLVFVEKGAYWAYQHGFSVYGRDEWIATIEARRAEKRVAVEVHTEAEVVHG